MPLKRNNSNLNSPLRLNAPYLKLFPQYPFYPLRQVDVTILTRLFFELRPKLVRKSDLILICFGLFLRDCHSIILVMREVHTSMTGHDATKRVKPGHAEFEPSC